MTTYLCVQCDERFDSLDRRPRCPACMRMHGVVPVETPAARPRSWLRWWWVTPLGFLVPVGLWWWMVGSQVSGGAGSAPDPRASDVQTVLSPFGEDTQRLAQALAAGSALGAWAQRVAGSGDALPRARALVSALLSGDQGAGFARLPLWAPRSSPPLTAAEAFAAMRNLPRPRLYPIEVAAVVVAGLGALDIPAMVVEIAAYPQESAPLDPSGCLGYFGVAVPRRGELPAVLDSYGGGRKQAQPAPGDVSVLRKAQVVAAMLGIRARTALEQQAPDQALREVDAALTLWPRSPMLRSVRAMALAANGGIVEGEAAARAALQLRGDAARNHNLAVYLLEQGEVEAAEKYVSRALALRPEFPPARVSLATVHMARGRYAEAGAELKVAAQAAPNLPGLMLAYAHYYAAQGDLDQAIEKGEQAVAAEPEKPQPLLSLARIYLAAGREQDMRRCARRALALAPLGRKAALREAIAAFLGPTALDSPSMDAGPASDP